MFLLPICCRFFGDNLLSDKMFNWFFKAVELCKCYNLIYEQKHFAGTKFGKSKKEFSFSSSNYILDLHEWVCFAVSQLVTVCLLHISYLQWQCNNKVLTTHNDTLTCFGAIMVKSVHHAQTCLHLQTNTNIFYLLRCHAKLGT